jgi:ribosomal protein S18 acetylase RimI-like enzyme
MTNYENFEERHLRDIVHLCLEEGWTSYADAATALRGLTAPGSVVVVAVEERVVGYVQLLTDGAVHAHVSNIVVAPSHRRQGIGHRLIECAFELSGAKYLDLVSTEGADAFYQSFDHKAFPGFRIYPQRARRT